MTTQPKTVPSVATDALYPAGSFVWSETPTKVDMPAGERATGHIPGERVPAQWENAFKNKVAAHLESVVDIAACNWEPVRDNTADADANGFVRENSFQAVVLESGGFGVQALVLLGNNNSVIWSEDLVNWTKNNVSAFTASMLAAGKVVATSYLITWNSTGAVKKSNDKGATWADAGDFPGANSGTWGTTLGAYLASVDRWIVVGVGTIQTSDALADSAWIARTPPAEWTGAPPPSPSAIAAGSDGVAVALNDSGSVVYSADGLTWSFSATGGGDPIKALAWNESHGLWVATDAAGKIWTAPSGATAWTQRAIVNSSAVAIGCLGRAFVLAASRIYVSADAENWAAVGPPPTDLGLWNALVAWQGALLAAAHIELVSDEDSAAFTRCLTLPAARF